MARRLFQNYFCQLYHFIVFFVKFSFFYLVSFAVSFLWVSSWLSAFIEILWYKHILCQLYASLCRLYLHGLQIVGYRPSLRRLKYLLYIYTTDSDRGMRTTDRMKVYNRQFVARTATTDRVMRTTDREYVYTTVSLWMPKIKNLTKKTMKWYNWQK